MRIADRVKEGTDTIGTGGLNLTGAKDSFLPFSTLPEGEKFIYVIEDGDNWEICSGIRTGNSLTRHTLRSSSGTTSITLSGSATVFMDVTSDWFASPVFETEDLGNIAGPVLLDPMTGSHKVGNMTDDVTISMDEALGDCTVFLLLTGNHPITLSDITWIGGEAPDFGTVNNRLIVFKRINGLWFADGGKAE